MLITIHNGTVDLDISIEEALALQEKLSKTIAHALKRVHSTMTLASPVEYPGMSKVFPGVVNISVLKEQK